MFLFGNAAYKSSGYKLQRNHGKGFTLTMNENAVVLLEFFQNKSKGE